MAGELILDTNIVVAMINGDPSVTTKLEQTEHVYVPNIVLGELYYGAFHSTRRDDNVARIDSFASERSILCSDRLTARYYGEIKNRLRAKGRPIPENDIWIAAIACQHELTLVSRDEHFREVEGLMLLEPTL